METAAEVATLFTPQQLARLDQARIPRHVAIIPDGNRRWAKKQRRHYDFGHRTGASALIQTIKAAKELGVKVMTFYLFSTENWSRSREEVAALMWLLKRFLLENCEEMRTCGIRLKTIGELSAFPKRVLSVVENTVEATVDCDQIDMVLALNYGGRDEIKRVLHRIIDKGLPKEQITESLIASYLDTAPWGDPDLLIRTSGEMRLSNFLLWQLSYAEIYIAQVLWPDFKPEHLLEAVVDFQKRERRLGGT